MTIQKTAAQENGALTAEQAKATILAERREREERAQVEIAEILKKQNCRLVPVVTIKGGNVQQSIEVMASD